LSSEQFWPDNGDVVLVNGLLGDHGAAILGARDDIALEAPISSDCAPLHDLIARVLSAAPATRFIRDPTRGGVATVLNEVAEAAQLAIEVDEAATPLRDEVRGFCEILGLDPLYLANEGKIVTIVPDEQAQQALAAMQAHRWGDVVEDVNRQHATAICCCGEGTHARTRRRRLKRETGSHRPLGQMGSHPRGTRRSNAHRRIEILRRLASGRLAWRGSRLEHRTSMVAE
jgi:hydrogenase expression/formation protein HypE